MYNAVQKKKELLLIGYNYIAAYLNILQVHSIHSSEVGERTCNYPVLEFEQWQY